MLKKCRNVNRHLDEVMAAGVSDKKNMLVVSLHPAGAAEKFLKHRKDGVLVELVGRQNYACDSAEIKNARLQMHPMYRKDIEKHKFIYPFKEQSLSINYGTLPEAFNSLDYELNLIIIQKRYLCSTLNLKNMRSHDLQLLETGLFPIEISPDSLIRIADKGLTSEFTMHYEQGQPKMPADQLKELIETIREIKNIQGIDVTGYASIEGSRGTNKKLFNARTDQVRKALTEAFPGVRVKASARENWEDFIYDVGNSNFSFLASRQKFMIKKIIKERDMYEDLEPMLANHRKVVVAVNARLSLEGMDREEIKMQYLSAYQEADLQRLLFIQKQVMQKIRSHELPVEFMKELNVPYRADVAPAYMNQLISMYEFEFNELMNTYYSMMEIYTLLPDDPQVLYNAIALMLRAMRVKPAEIDQEELDRMMHKINKSTLDKKLRQRVWVNYYMLMVIREYGAGNYRKVNKFLSNIRSLYSGAAYSEDDLLRLSKYFLNYGNQKFAEEVLYPIVYNGTGNKEVIFFYLPLTLSNAKFYRQQWYQDLLEKAHGMDAKRYCRMFNNSKKGGVSFQLLRIDELKERYCDWCE
jgi:hypothetical protein